RRLSWGDGYLRSQNEPDSAALRQERLAYVSTLYPRMRVDRGFHGGTDDDATGEISNALTHFLLRPTCPTSQGTETGLDNWTNQAPGGVIRNTFQSGPLVESSYYLLAVDGH
ncbi:hypothetical protein BaRGS_00036505, partial [Batillaria attramentaria]